MVESLLLLGVNGTEATKEVTPPSTTASNNPSCSTIVITVLCQTSFYAVIIHFMCDTYEYNIHNLKCMLHKTCICYITIPKEALYISN
jgi:hypothetical protein